MTLFKVVWWTLCFTECKLIIIDGVLSVKFELSASLEFFKRLVSNFYRISAVNLVELEVDEILYRFWSTRSRLANTIIWVNFKL